MAQVIELEDIYTALSSSKPTLYKAIVSLIFSSSMSTSTISRLTLYDFLYACDEYFEAEEEKIFDNLLKKITVALYKKALRKCNMVFFENPENHIMHRISIASILSMISRLPRSRSLAFS